MILYTLDNLPRNLNFKYLLNFTLKEVSTLDYGILHNLLQANLLSNY